VAQFQKVWLDIAQWGFAAPIENLPHYGQQFAERVSEASLLLLSDYPAEEKEPLLINFTQAGIDFWGLVRAGHTWPAHGGLNSGRKWPIIFAGLMLGDEDMLHIEKNYPDVRFHEDDQTAFGPVKYRGQTFDKSFSGSRAIFMGHSPYQFGRSGHWERGRGIVDVYHPRDWPRPGNITSSEGYRRANTRACWVGQALAARLMHAERHWNHDAFFDYCDRWMSEDDTELIKIIQEATGQGQDYGKSWAKQGSSWDEFVNDMWARYRPTLSAPMDGWKQKKAEGLRARGEE
jgi:hypothetical protein